VIFFSEDGKSYSAYIELNGDDKALIASNASMEWKTESLVRRAEVLDFLPPDLKDNWPGSGEVINHDIADSPYTIGAAMTIGKDDRKIWIREGKEPVISQP
jgi:hypothetical protein